MYSEAAAHPNEFVGLPPTLPLKFSEACRLLVLTPGFRTWCHPWTQERVVLQIALQRQGTREMCCRRVDRCGCGGTLGEEGRDRRMAVEISGVTLCPSDDRITGAWLDHPRTGLVDGYAFEVSGWVVSKALVASLEFVHEQSVVASCELTWERLDVASVYGSSSPVKFWNTIGTVGLAPAFTVGVRVVFQDGGTQQLAPALTSLHAANHGCQCRPAI